MNPPALDEIVAEAARLAPDSATISQLATALVKCVGADRVSTVEAARRAASTDFAHLSPVLVRVLPKLFADVVVYPRSVDELVTAVGLACEHDVPIVARGKGTGNYGQAVPLAAGMVIDLTSMHAVLEMGEGWVRAEAGATFVALEASARRLGQEIAMLPTTVGSTLGGFLAGGAGGMGSIEHGWLWDGFCRALEVVTCPPHGGVRSVHGAQCVPYLHAYGVSGIIATATVALAPARDRVAVMASFSDDAAAQAGLALMRLEPPPRLVCVDDPALVATYPVDPAMPPHRFSLRSIVDTATIDAVREIIASHGGRIEAELPDGAGYLSTLAFNHVTLRAKKARPGLCHLQVGGQALVIRPDRVRAALPGAMLHLDGLTGRSFGGLLLSEFRDTRTLYAGIARLTELGVHVVDPHTWLLGGPAVGAIAETAAANDPKGLFNPGKLKIT